MKFRRTFGGLLRLVGCVALLIAAAATVVPMIDNAQLQRILASFAMRDERPIIQGINLLVSSCLRYNYYVGAAGAALIVIGTLLRVGTRPAPAKEEATESFRPHAENMPAKVSAVEKTVGLQSTQIVSSITDKLIAKPIVPILKSDTEHPPMQETSKETVQTPRTKRCPACKTENNIYAVFCRRCGVDLPPAQEEDFYQNRDELQTIIQQATAATAKRPVFQAPHMAEPEDRPPIRVQAEPVPEPAESPAEQPQEEATPKATVEPPQKASAIGRALQEPLVGGRAIRLENIVRPDAIQPAKEAEPVPPAEAAPSSAPMAPTVYVSINTPYPTPMVSVSPPSAASIAVSAPPASAVSPVAATEPQYAPNQAETPAYEPNEPQRLPHRISARITSTVGIHAQEEA